MFRRNFLLLLLASLFSALNIAPAFAQNADKNDSEEGAAEPGTRHTYRFSERAGHNSRMNFEGTLEDTKGSMTSQAGVNFITRGLIEPLILQSWGTGAGFTNQLLSHFYQEEDRYSAMLKERGGPRDAERYAKCMREQSDKIDPIAGAEKCSGIDKSGPEFDNKPPSDADDKDKDEDVVLSRETTVSHELGLRIADKAVRKQYEADFRKGYGDKNIKTEFHKNGQFSTKLEDLNPCEAGGRAKACDDVKKKRNLGFGFDGKLYKLRKDTLAGLGQLLTRACEDLNKRADAANTQGPLAMYSGGSKVDFDFWSNINIVTGVEYTDPDSNENILVNRINIRPGFPFDDSLGKSFLDIIEIDSAGKKGKGSEASGVKTQIDCSRTREAYSNNFYDRIYDMVEVRDESDDLEKFLFRYANIIGGFRAVAEVESDVKNVRDLVSVEEDPVLEKLARAVINSELGALEQIDVQVNISNLDIEGKIQVASQYLHKDLNKLLEDIKKYVAQGRGEKLPALATNVRSAGAAPR